MIVNLAVSSTSSCSNSRFTDKRFALYAGRFFALTLTASNNKLITCHSLNSTAWRNSDELRACTASLFNIAIKMHIILWTILCNLLIFIAHSAFRYSIYLPLFLQKFVRECSYILNYVIFVMHSSV